MACRFQHSPPDVPADAQTRTLDLMTPGPRTAAHGEPRVTSLRRRLTLALWIAMLAVGLISAGSTYLLAQNEANDLLDFQMEEIAKVVATQSFQRVVPAIVIPRIDRDLEDSDDFIVVVDDKDGKRLYSSRPDWPLPTQTWLGFRTLQVKSLQFRVFSARSNDLHITVAQQVETRRETATNAALSALLPVVLFLPVMGIVIGLVITRGLMPLRSLAADVAGRMPVALTPLKTAGLPVEVRPLVDEINELLKRLRIALDADQLFISDAAHALRTPLTALQLQADVLDGSPDQAERATRLEALRAGIRRAVKLADQLLTLARHSADMPAEDAETVLDDILADVLELYRTGAAAGSGIVIVGELLSQCRVAGTPRHLTLLFGNLVDNALRYTPRGGEVCVRSELEPGGTHVQVEVLDQGPGIPEAEMERVFDRFYRVPGDPSEGNGLGLATVRAICSSLGGVVRLANRLDGSGLIVTVRLPTKPVRHEPGGDSVA
jgi:two-component system OmpR family sensor kinase